MSNLTLFRGKTVFSELMARRGYSLGARLLAAVFWPQSADPHGHVTQRGPVDHEGRLPLGRTRPRDRQTAPRGKLIRSRLGRPLYALIFQGVVALLRFAV